MMKTMRRRWVALTILGAIAAVFLGDWIDRLVFNSVNIYSFDQIWMRGIFASFVGVGSTLIISIVQSCYFLPAVKNALWWVITMTLFWWFGTYIIYVSGFTFFPQPIGNYVGKEISRGILIALLICAAQVYMLNVPRNQRSRWILINAAGIIGLFVASRLLNLLAFGLSYTGIQYGNLGNAVLDAITDYILPWFVYGLITARAIVMLHPSRSLEQV